VPGAKPKSATRSAEQREKTDEQAETLRRVRTRNADEDFAEDEVASMTAKANTDKACSWSSHKKNDANRCTEEAKSEHSVNNKAHQSR
jgi:hypothetical protein